jgi:hypothetical protein
VYVRSQNRHKFATSRNIVSREVIFWCKTHQLIKTFPTLTLYTYVECILCSDIQKLRSHFSDSHTYYRGYERGYIYSNFMCFSLFFFFFFKFKPFLFFLEYVSLIYEHYILMSGRGHIIINEGHVT